MKIPKPKKKISLRSAIRVTSRDFAEFIKTRDCLSTSGSMEMGKCYTCGKFFTRYELEAGHFLPGRHRSILLDERACHIQCILCNRTLMGNPDAYRMRMMADYGQTVIDEIEKMNRLSRDYTIEELIKLRRDFRARTACLILRSIGQISW